MTPLTRADVERLLQLGLSLRQAAGALGVLLPVALAALEGPAAVVAVPVPVAAPSPVRQPVRRGKALAVAEGAA